MILPYKISTTKNKITARAGLVVVGEILNRLNFDDLVDEHFPQPKSNRGYCPSLFVKTFVLMHHTGAFRLDDVELLEQDQVLKSLLGVNNFPQAHTLGGWLRRTSRAMGDHNPWLALNQPLIKASFGKRRDATLDIDASEIISNKTSAEWTYKNNKGFMPMVGHLAETGHVVATDFRKGNEPPNKNNLEFIQQAERSMPAGVKITRMRGDAAAYQIAIIEHCDSKGIQFAIRAKKSANMVETMTSYPEQHWNPMLDRNNKPIKGIDVCRTSHCIGDYEQAFTLVLQRTRIDSKPSESPQMEFGFAQATDADAHNDGVYIYRAIATNRDDLSDSEIIHWYNQRAEDSENRIKELKRDFGGETLPCSDFQANELYFLLTALSYNIFATMRNEYPQHFGRHRVKKIRHHVYCLAGKLVKSGRKTILKLGHHAAKLLASIVSDIRQFEPPAPAT